MLTGQFQHFAVDAVSRAEFAQRFGGRVTDNSGDREQAC